jgi:hypothetical protein
LGEFTFDCALGESQGIYVKSLDSGPGLGERLQTGFNGYHKHSFGTEGGLSLAFVNYSGQESLHDIWLLGCQGDREPLLRTRFRERFPELSPDGHLFAYTSTQSGRDEVYVSRFSEPGRSKQVSISGGYEPCWSRDGREIFYRLRTSDGLINYYAVSVTSTEADFQVGIPEKLFSGLYEGASPVRSYDVGPDGRFLLISFDPDQPIEILKTIAPTRIELVQNWFEELREKVPTE